MIANLKKVCALALLTMLLLNQSTFGQTIIFNNAPPIGTGSTAVGVSGGIVFNLTSNKPIIVENFRIASSANTNTATIWYHPNKINGQPAIANMNAAGGWVNLGSATHTGAGTTAIATIPVNCNLRVNAGDTFGIFIQFSGGNVYSTTTTTNPTYTDGTVTFIADPTCAFTRNATTWFGPTRQFNGGVIYKPAQKGGNDASVSQLVSASRFCGNSQPLTVKIANKGINAINSVNVNWAIDGVPQTPLNLVTLLDTLNHPVNKNDTNITLGNITYTPGVAKVIQVWTTLPNGVTDTITSNDSLRVVLQPGLNGTYTIANGTANFNSFTSVINKIDSFGKCGPLVFNVSAGSIFTHQPVSITNLDSITFQKSGTGANPLVYGVRGLGTTDAVFRIAGSRNIVFDGIDVADSASNLANNERMEFGYALINSTPTTGSSNNVIRNSRVTLNRTNTATFGIVQSASATAGGVTATSLSGGNHNNRYENVKIENTYKGIGLIGTAAFPDSNCVVTSTGNDTTIVGADVPNDIGNGTLLVYGINAADQKNVEISKCLVRNLTSTGTSTNQGIFIDNGSTTVDYGIARVFGNTVHTIVRTTSTSATGTVHGIRIDVSTAASARVWNNVVYNINNTSTIATATANQMVRGISLGTTTGTGNAEFYFNSVSINSNNVGLANSSAAFWKGGVGSAIVRNNIFSNASPAQTGVAKHYASYINAGNVVASNNVYWAPNANGFIGFVGSDRTSLPVFAAATSTVAPANGNEQGSAYADPNFASTGNLNFTAATPAVNSAMPITNPIIINTDILGNTRSTTTPTIGAFESTQTLVDSAAPVITSIQVINAANPIIRATITDNSGASSAGNIRLWYRLGASGAFTSVAPDSVPTGTINGVYRWSTAFTSLATGSYQFYIAARDNAGAGLNISVNPIQAASFTGFGASDPVNFANNPDASANTRTFVKTNTLAGGTYPVGAGGPTYFKLTDVANALNSSEITGNVIFELQSNYDGTTGEVFPIVFNPVATSGGNWTVTIRPASGVSNRETSGYPASGQPLIHLNGISRITFDGRPGGSGSNIEWTLRAKRTASANTSPAIQLSNGSQRNTFTHLRVEADNIATTTGAITLLGTSTTDGNSFNRISNNIISERTDSSGALAIGVYALGTAGISNDSNVILNNQIANWSTTGVHVTATGNGADWQILNNSFFMTAARSTAQTSIRFEAGATAHRTRINDNFIGGSAPNCGGTALTNSVAGVWRGIVCSASLTDSVRIHNNTIQNINLTGGTGTFAGIELTGALASVRGNTIGHPSTSNSIQTSQLGTIISIWLNNVNNMAFINNNTIANINSTGNSTAVGHNGIRVTTANTTTPLVISNNTIGNLGAANPTTVSTTASLVGILSVYAGTQQSIERNTIFGLVNNNNASTNVFGINISSTNSSGIINANHVYNLINTSGVATAQTVGIHLDLGNSWLLANNMIALGLGIDSACVVTGIQDKTAGANHRIIYNSVLITGSTLSPLATNSFGYRRTTNGITNLRNNIFQNTRTGGLANFAIGNTSATPSAGWQANHNVLSAANSLQTGLWNTTAVDLATWKSSSLFDSASISTAASFVSSTDLHLTAPTLGDTAFAGRPFAGLTTDFDGHTRNASFPYRGADENLSFPLPVVLTSFTANADGADAVLKWQTSSETNNSHFEIERSIDGQSFEYLGKVKGQGNSNRLHNYSYKDGNASEQGQIVYYRLRQVDFDGKYSYTETRMVNFEKQVLENGISIYPNPFTHKLIIESNTTPYALVEIAVYDLSGKLMLSLNGSSANEVLVVEEVNKLEKGIYILQVKANGQSSSTRLVKE